MIERFLGLAALILIAPVLLVISVCILVFEGRPIFFVQKRVGMKGREFDIFKYRTMVVKSGTENGAFDAGSASRVTKIGKILRKSKLDELPQLWNIVNGTMSFVGPRPEIREWVNAFPLEWQKIHQFKPGITDPASIVYRNEEEELASSENPKLHYKNEILPKKLKLYQNYINNKSLFEDISIILQTIKVVLKG